MSVNEKPLVVVTRKLPDGIASNRMRELFTPSFNLDDTPLTPEQIAEAVRSAESWCPTSPTRSRRASQAARLQAETDGQFRQRRRQYRCHRSACARITVTNTPKVLTEDTADMTMATDPGGAATADRRRLDPSPRQELAGLVARPGMLGHRIGGKRLGIIGHGPHRPGGGAPAPMPSACKSTTNNAPSTSRRRSPTNWARPIWESLDQMLAAGWISSR